MITDKIATIRKEFRRSSEARYIHRLHGVLLVLSGMSSVQVGKLLHNPRRSVSIWVSKFNKYGASGLEDAEKPGRPATLNAVQERAIEAALKKSPKESGMEGDAWTGALVATFINKRYRIQMTMRHCRRILRSVESKMALGR
jgi:transposase